MIAKVSLNIISCCFLVLSLIAAPGLCDVPGQIRFQGRLTDPSGTPLDGFHDMTFRLYDALTGGLELWSETQIDVELTNGIYNISLGQPGNEIAPTLMDGPRWLEVAVEGETLAPRQAITSTAYALKAGDADTLDENSITDLDTRYVNKDQAGAVTSAMIADNTIGTADLADDSVGRNQIAPAAVGMNEVAGNSLTASNLDEDSVGNSELAPNSVSSAEIINGSVTANDIQDGAVLTEIRDDDGSGSLLDADLVDGQDSGDFASIHHSHNSTYVNVSGDTMTGSLTVENTLSVGTDAGDDNDAIYMDSGVAEWLRWENGLTRFQLSDALNVAGGTLAVGSHTIQPAYNSIGVGTPESASIGGATDLYVHDDLETGDDVHAGGDLSIAGNLYIGTDDGANNDWIYMDDGGEYFRWDDDLDNNPGNGLDGGFFYSDELEVSGSVGISGSSSEFRYKTPKTRYLNIPACAFVKDDFDRDTLWTPYLGYVYTAHGGASDACTAYAPVYLPEGAVVTHVEVRYYDHHAAENVAIGFNLNMYLNDTVSLYVMADGSTLSSGDSNTIHDLPDDDGIIGHNPIASDRSYYLSVSWNPTGLTWSPRLRFYGATITYTVDRVAN